MPASLSAALPLPGYRLTGTYAGLKGDLMMNTS